MHEASLCKVFNSRLSRGITAFSVIGFSEFPLFTRYFQSKFALISSNADQCNQACDARLRTSQWWGRPLTRSACWLIYSRYKTELKMTDTLKVCDLGVQVNFRQLADDLPFNRSSGSIVFANFENVGSAVGSAVENSLYFHTRTKN